jgi:hypothetical protein
MATAYYVHLHKIAFLLGKCFNANNNWYNHRVMALQFNDQILVMVRKGLGRIEFLFNYLTPLHLLDFQKVQTILSHFDGVFCVFMGKLQLFDLFLATLSHFRRRKWLTDLSAVDSLFRTLYVPGIKRMKEKIKNGPFIKGSYKTTPKDRYYLTTRILSLHV